MKNSFTIALLFLLFFCPAHAQMRKCLTSAGTVIISNTPCEKISTESIKLPTEFTTYDPGPKQNYVAPNPIRSAPTVCKFAAFAMGDTLGKTLAENAKQECERNNQAKLVGGPVSLEHYNYWRDHSQQETARRGSISRSVDSAIGSIGKSMNCTPNGFGGMSCN